MKFFRRMLVGPLGMWRLLRSAAKGQGPSGGRSLVVLDLLVICLISGATIWLAYLIASFSLYRTWETQSADIRMRLLLPMTGGDTHAARPDVTVLALDDRTKSKLGIFRTGQWVARKPYVDQLRFFEEYFRPSVLAYDILFQDWLGETTGQIVRVSESAEQLKGISREIGRVADRASEVVPSTTLSDIVRLATEQAEIFLNQRFASIVEHRCFPSVIGYNFRGGWIDSQPVVIPRWSDDDVFGQDPAGKEEAGRRIPYLLDISLSPAAVHFPSRAAAANYEYSPNANFPTLGLLDYTLIGYLNVPRDEDGVVRRVPLVTGLEYVNRITREHRRVFVPAFSLMAAMIHLGIRFPLRDQDPSPIDVWLGREIVLRPPDRPVIRIPIDEHGNMYVNFNALFDDFKTISFSEVAPSYIDTDEAFRDRLAGQYRNSINRHIVLVGNVATGMGDIGATPLNAETPMVHVHAMAINNILDGDFVRPLKPGHHLLLGLLLFALFTAICIQKKLSTIAPALGLFMVLYLIATYASVYYHWVILPVIWPLLYMALCSFGVLLYRYFAAERARLRIRSMFSAMVSADILTYLERNPESFSLAGHTAETTIFFSDIAQFTNISEHLPPAQMTRLIHAYFTPITECIMQHGGCVTNYIGDGVMAVWGAPFPNPRHAVNACLAAIDQQAIVQRLNVDLQREFNLTINVRMGLNSGSVTAGNMGSARRLQYTVMGDSVNLAARLEPVNDDYGTRIVIGETTWQQARDQVVARWLDTIVVKGRVAPVRIYELIGRPADVPAATRTLIAAYEEAFALYSRREWTAALAILEKILASDKDGPSRNLSRRIHEYQMFPPAEGWQGEYVRTAKD